MSQKITPCLWFDFNAAEAVAFCLRTFGDGRILRTSYYGDAMPQLRGKVMLIEFELGRSCRAARSRCTPIPIRPRPSARPRRCSR